MIELSRHIESLLLTHDCVIVPGLGGFVTHYVPARRIAEEQLFLPPSRSVGFNQQLTLNDGLLVQSYMQAYDTNYPETLKLLEEGVNRLKQQIEEEGQFELSGIGTLRLGIGGKYSFVPCEAGVLAPELYGLDALPLRSIEQEVAGDSESQPLRTSKHRTRKVSLRRTEGHYTFSIHREILNYVAAAAVAVFFYVLWATPVAHVGNTGQTASNFFERLFVAPEADAAAAVAPQSQPQPVAKQTPAPKVQPETPAAVQQAAPEAEAAPQAGEPAPVASPTAQSAPAPGQSAAAPVQPAERSEAAPAAQSAPAPEAKKQAEAGRYTIVLASAITQANAEQFVAQLQSEGYREAAVYKRGRMVRVVYGAYTSEQEAQARLRKLRQSEAFADAWVMDK